MEQNKKIEPPKEETQSKVVHTYAEDMAEVIEDAQSGLVKKIIHGAEEHDREKRNLSPESRKNKFFMFGSFVFIVIGILTLFNFLSKGEVPTALVARQFIPLIFNDSSGSIDTAGLSRDAITQAVSNEVKNTSVKVGGVEGIYLIKDKQDIGLRAFALLMKSSLVLENNPDLVSNKFLMGVVNSGVQADASTGKDFFILLKMRSAADIFTSLRAWEEKMFSDLHGFFGITIDSSTNYLSIKDFEDGIIQNKNARMLYDKDGNIVMMYIYADDNSVIITNTENAAREIMLRLAASQIKK